MKETIKQADKNKVQKQVDKVRVGRRIEMNFLLLHNKSRNTNLSTRMERPASTPARLNIESSRFSRPYR